MKGFRIGLIRHDECNVLGNRAVIDFRFLQALGDRVSARSSLSYKMRSAIQQFIWLSIVIDVSIGKISVLSLSMRGVRGHGDDIRFVA